MKHCLRELPTEYLTIFHSEKKEPVALYLKILVVGFREKHLLWVVDVNIFVYALNAEGGG